MLQTSIAIRSEDRHHYLQCRYYVNSTMRTNTRGLRGSHGTTMSYPNRLKISLTVTGAEIYSKNDTSHVVSNERGLIQWKIVRCSLTLSIAVFRIYWGDGIVRYQLTQDFLVTSHRLPTNSLVGLEICFDWRESKATTYCCNPTQNSKKKIEFYNIIHTYII